MDVPPVQRGNVRRAEILPQLRAQARGEGGAVMWRKYRSRVLATLGLMSVWIAAIVAVQPAVTPPPLPLVQVSAKAWATTNIYRDTVTVAGVDYTVDIPSGFECDLASLGPLDIPLGIERDHPAIRRGALNHDWLYRTKKYPREIADLILYQCCLQDGMEPAKARAVFDAVRVWGGAAWGR